MDCIDMLCKVAGWFDQPCKIITKDGEKHRGIFSATRHDGAGHIMIVLTNKSKVEEFAHTEIQELSFF